tara:strand:+ start:670 stop:858 length:189 start_codon:yes stop_codon:yes gene_type:complete
MLVWLCEKLFQVILGHGINFGLNYGLDRVKVQLSREYEFDNDSLQGVIGFRKATPYVSVIIY